MKEEAVQSQYLTEPWVHPISLSRISVSTKSEVLDNLAAEEPLEIRVAFFENDDRVEKNISVTMRTPGRDEELATGFLFTEGIISKNTKVRKEQDLAFICGKGRENIILIVLARGSIPRLASTERNFYTTSSCGVCGKSSIASIRTLNAAPERTDQLIIDRDILFSLAKKLRAKQEVFTSTGGLHACGLFSPSGTLLISREDVGRHNALDKLIGSAFLDEILPLNNHILLLSGRASFELIQKAAMAGILIVAAIGAPSSLAVQLAQEFNITLIGFLKDTTFNIYTGAHRINTSS